MKASIRILGTDLLCRSQDSTHPESRLDGSGALPALQGWAARYDIACRRGDDAALLAIGRELFEWLDPSGWAGAWARGGGPRQLEIRVSGVDSPLALALLDAPWELLALPEGHLADDSVQLFELARRIGEEAPPPEPRHADLQLLFMAAAPRGEHPLSFEEEESAILTATQRLPLHLVVEESGAPGPLGERLDLDGPFEALHLSCHGDIDPAQGPVLALEDETGALALTTVGQLVGALGDPRALPLVFLSACRTAEQADTGPRSSEPFVRELIRAGIANVLGWDGSVYDSDALAFAEHFYGELASLQCAPRAAAVARQALRQRQLGNPQEGRHWHLARLYLGPQGGGPLAARGKPKRKPAGGEEQFLDAAHQQVPVAGRGEFVGRRRPTQDVIRAFRSGEKGVLIHGMGNLGKSSLAYRIATRHPRHTKVVVFGRYDALAIFDRLCEALPAAERRPVIDTWRNAVLANAGELADALEALLDGPFDTRPILLVIDDLERILEAPSPSDATATPLRADFRAPLAAVLHAFRRARTESRLLVTSRYRFSLPAPRGDDLADTLVAIPLQPMDETDRRKQLRSAARLARQNGPATVDKALLHQAQLLADGNPGLQAVLTRPILVGETEVAAQAMAHIGHYQQHGVPPADIQRLIDQGAAADTGNATLAFFKRMAFHAYRQALTPAQAELLRAACLFSPGLPVPRSALEAAGQAAGVSAPAAALDRLIGLGLVDDWGQEDTVAQVATNPLARPLAIPLDDTLRARLADAALPQLERHWRASDGAFPLSLRAVEVAHLALAATTPAANLLNDATTSAALFLFHSQKDARQALHTLLQPAMQRLKAQSVPPSTGLFLIAADCAERLGEVTVLDQVLDACTGLEGDASTLGSVLLRRGYRQSTLGNPSAAHTAFTEAATQFDKAGAIRDRAIALGEIADIHYARGELDEALRIRIDEQLPVFGKLGDVRSRAVTLGKIADIHFARGELDEALRIRIDEQLPVFEKLGDVRSRAITLGKIADIHYARGELDEALRIRIDEEMPVFEKLGDVRERAVTLGRIADIHYARGELDEALRILIDEEMPVYEKLGDVRSRAITLGQITQIYLARGELDQALALNEQRRPIAESLGDLDSLAHIGLLTAEIRLQRGDHLRGELQSIHDDLATAFALSIKLGRPDFIGGVGVLLAQVLAMGGLKGEALGVLDAAEQAWSKLGNTQGIANIATLRAMIAGPH